MERWVGLGASLTTSSTSAASWKRQQSLNNSLGLLDFFKPLVIPGGLCFARLLTAARRKMD